MKRYRNVLQDNVRELTPLESWLQFNKGKQYCRYAVWDLATGVLLAFGEKYKVNQNLTYEQSFRCLFRKVSAYSRFTSIKDRFVEVVYWFNVPKKHKPFHCVTDAGLLLGLR